MKSEAEEQTTLTYIALGDSLTMGIGASETDYLRMNAFVPQLTAYLRKNFDVYVENHGMPGITSAELLDYVRHHPGMDRLLRGADVLTLTIGGNDLLQLLNRDALNEETIEQTVEQFGELFEQIIVEIRQHQPNAPIYVLELYSPYDKRHALHKIGQTTVQTYNDELARRIQKLNNVFQVKIFKAFQGKEAQWTHIDHNDVHPNDEGYAAIFEAFQKLLRLDALTNHS